jgi:hypothetical protein
MFPLFASARGLPALALAIGPALAQGTFPVGKVSWAAFTISRWLITSSLALVGWSACTAFRTS